MYERQKINEAMKMAVKALALLAKESVPEQVNIAYGEIKLNFGRDYIIPCSLIHSWLLNPIGKYEEELLGRLGMIIKWFD
jgi:malate dehydrogenase (oxaloacetate-decarboxylating)(NADP+)